MSPRSARARLPELREATAADVPAMLEVFFHAMEDLDERRGRALLPRNAAPLEMHLEHLLTTDPNTAYVADDDGRIVAFGILMCRGRHAFLSFLFVLPAWQRHRLGRAVLDACLRAAGEAASVATCAEADQPVSTGLYASVGMAPRVPLYLLRGSLAADALPALRPGLRRRTPTHDALEAIDRPLVGYVRPQDHAFWSRERHASLFVDEAGAVVGYGYAHPSGRIGPVAAADPLDLPAFVGDLVRSVAVLEARQLVMPGPAIACLRPLLAGGMRIDGTPAVYCSTGPEPRLDRYVPMSYALL